MCLQCAMPARTPPVAPAIKLTDVVRVAGEKRRAIVIDARVNPAGKVWAFGVMFRNGLTSYHAPADLTYVAPALG